MKYYHVHSGTSKAQYINKVDKDNNLFIQLYVKNSYTDDNKWYHFEELFFDPDNNMAPIVIKIYDSLEDVLQDIPELMLL